ncbi:MAG: prepilin-type N-terminal cleavage/methylation domain-containing protein [Lachnospiraceae bacterium]|nr:prepilin-type N-terminal cleavage/methylation domain-containing protein [Lachnospiraceae bacterium]
MKKEMNNKGFSLVELIIVIAIMVILIAVLAPQYLRYVEKARVSSDQNTIVEYIDAMQTVAADPEINLDSSKTYTVTVNTDGTIAVSGDLTTVLTDYAILDSNTLTTSKVQSTAYKEHQSVITLKYDTAGAAGSAKLWQVSVTGGVFDQSGALIVTP